MAGPEGGWTGAEALRGMLVPLDQLRQDPANARRHPQRNVDAIAASLRGFGQQKPVVVRQGVILAGNGTFDAARSLGWTQLAVVVADQLSEEQARAFALADNQTGALAEWDFSAVAAALRDMPEAMRELTGFAAFEIEPLLQGTFTPAAINPEQHGKRTDGMVTYLATKEQAVIINGAIEAIRARDDGPAEVPEGRCLELLCADFLSGDQPQPS